MRSLSIAYLAPEGYENPLREELEFRGVRILWQRGRLFGASGAAVKTAWAQNTWLNPEFHPISSIAGGAALLRGIQRNWSLVPDSLFRRASLIQQRLPAVARHPFVFDSPLPVLPMGGWMLWDEHTILASSRCSSSFPNGEIRFAEDPEGPPSRAYLKLWEAFTLTGRQPGPGDLCLDLGSAPGGWTWVLARLGARVFSVDKAPLAPHVERLPGVNHCARSSAFGIAPEFVGNIDWLFCDVACYPQRLFNLIEKWVVHGMCRNFVCTMKLQGETDCNFYTKFESIEGSCLIHLSQNKHELTWIRFTI